MDLGSIAKDFADAGLHVLGAALGGAAGNDVAGMIASHLGLENATPEKLAQALQDPAQLLKLRELNVNLAEARISADTQRIQAVNAIMQAEAKSGRGGWRSVIGYTLSATFALEGITLCVLLIAAYVQGHFTFIGQLPVIIGAFTALTGSMLPVVGISAHHEGKLERIQAGEK